MSTKIEDLPGPPIKSDVTNPPPPPPQPTPSQLPKDVAVGFNTTNVSLQETQPNTNVKADIKKRVRFSDRVDQKTISTNESQPAQPENFISALRGEINEENLIMTLLFFLACHPSFNKTVTAIPVIGSYLSDSGLVSTALKAIVLFVVFVLLKIYTLPYVRL